MIVVLTVELRLQAVLAYFMEIYRLSLGRLIKSRKTGVGMAAFQTEMWIRDLMSTKQEVTTYCAVHYSSHSALRDPVLVSAYSKRNSFQYDPVSS
jgi:hypothetical protein